jgi:threonylcarbamoyladenosine tRNA methylthiotransferase MtaB
MNVQLTSLGCRLNEAEQASWSRQFGEAGHQMVDTAEAADLVVINTCAVTAEASRKSRKLIRRFHRLNPQAKLILTGCYADLEAEQAADIAGVDLVVSNRDKDRLVQIVSDKLDLKTMPVQAQEGEGLHLYRPTRTRAFVKVQDGCRNRCTFCIVTVARGEERSRPVDDVVAEIAELVALGHQEIVLTGVHLGGYGHELGVDLYRLVNEILQQTSVKRLRLSSLEPWEIPDNFWQLWKDKRLLPHLHLPVQSGSDQILRRMARRSDSATIRRLAKDARAQLPKLALTSDIIVGFPGETADDWQQTLDLVQEIGFAHIHIFSYSPREGTAASRFKDAVDSDTKRERSRVLHEIAATMKRQVLESSLGKEFSVLWEGRAQLGTQGQKKLNGFTENYLKATIEVSASRDLENTIQRVRAVTIDGEELRVTCGTEDTA